ncbi:gamma-glutamylcyclotransferase family protein [Colwellia sp. E2M01]|uniref:gamma-glutamylcyclotransferase family protein n=1 Tax=Colwellia sp. E2M01 TaxID=2841561 RepID=UPI001C0A2FF4|nr:gamma-glutamylcyclotransferase family protein [Colwellia sp. E2M01]MBU2869447.1 gamma-glutamylcyclotransferase [Colwellia sp. E2M01]
MENLFSYGTLQLEPVQTETFGRLLKGKKDILVGYVLDEVRITDAAVLKTSGKEFHPILKYTGNDTDTVAGTIFEITAQELAQADEYEVDDYIRISGDFTSGATAWIYACRKQHKPQT